MAPVPSLVPADYVDASVFAREVHDVLRASWVPVGRADEVPEAGDYRARTLAGDPVLLVRTAEDGVAVLANVCPHRGSRVVDDASAGRASALVCPYHRWAFRLDGSLVGAPYAEGADLEGACLAPIRHVEWNGFVLVNPSGDAPDPAADLAGLSEHLAPWRWPELVTVASRTFESEWNWKVMVENWIECYHHVGAHRETVEVLWPAANVELVDPGTQPWVAMTVAGVDGVGAAPDRMPGIDDDRAGELSVWSAFPLLLGGSTASHAFWLQVEPTDATHHRVTWHLLAHPDQLPGPGAIEERLAEVTLVHVEDMKSCRDVQAGLASGRIDRFRLTRLEQPIADFQRWVAGRLGRTT